MTAHHPRCCCKKCLRKRDTATRRRHALQAGKPIINIRRPEADHPWRRTFRGQVQNPGG